MQQSSWPDVAPNKKDAANKNNSNVQTTNMNSVGLKQNGWPLSKKQQRGQQRKKGGEGLDQKRNLRKFILSATSAGRFCLQE